MSNRVIVGVTSSELDTSQEKTVPLTVKTEAQVQLEMLPKLDDDPSAKDWGGVPVRPIASLSLGIKVVLPGPWIRTRDLDRLFAYPDLTRGQAAERICREYDELVRAQLAELEERIATMLKRTMSETFPNANFEEAP